MFLAPLRAIGGDAAGIGQTGWVASDPQVFGASAELAARRGCATIAAVTLPLWFVGLFLGFDGRGGLAATVLQLVFVALAVIGAGFGIRRLRATPDALAVRADGTLEVRRKRRIEVFGRPSRLDIGPSGSLRSVVAVSETGERRYLPSELEQFDDFVACLRSRLPNLEVNDRRVP